MQKEDFLRPDLGVSATEVNEWVRNLRTQYDCLRPVPDRFLWPGLFGRLSYCSATSVESVRCVGNHNQDKSPAFPRMHHKFLIFCDADYEENWTEMDGGGSWSVQYHFDVRPYAVWTGSFNFTSNATKSLENAVVLRDADIVKAYYREWEQIEALSEPLDWTSPWLVPEWRIGS